LRPLLKLAALTARIKKQREGPALEGWALLFGWRCCDEANFDWAITAR
jgi:hypothetical protein